MVQARKSLWVGGSIAPFALVMAVAILHLYATRPGPLREAQQLVVIERGDSVTTITEKLAEARVISRPWLFRLVYQFYKRTGMLQAGEYEFTAYASPEAVLHKLEDGDVYLRQFTITEGRTVKEIVAQLNAIPQLFGTISEKEIPEGSLLPETYQFTYGETRHAVISRMQTQQKSALQKMWDARTLKSEAITTQEDAITLASIVEKEAVVAEERPIIAQVFLNRLEVGMPLQSDPTVIYPLTGGLSRLNRPITRSDLQVNSPYNTYKNIGLPPTPIGNPGRAALEAVLNPKPTDAIFFVADGTGRHRFSESYADHNKNITKFRTFLKDKEKAKKEKEAKELAAKNPTTITLPIPPASLMGPPLPKVLQQDLVGPHLPASMQ